MKNFKSWLEIDFTPLTIIDETKDMILYESFMLEDVHTETSFPNFDELYYKSLEAQLVHLFHKFENGWITSPRQVMKNSDECISNVHFVMSADKKLLKINVFQRSSNLYNLKEDVQFFNYFKKKYLEKDVPISIFVSMPHVFKHKNIKVEQEEVAHFPKLEVAV